ncbi:VOC family protein [Pseudonocardia zijingensis]|jgi:catechol 2,3-dioxygenase-like lactoylglutathione lyase family enzyme|uniref:VOC family protein n=1 Tax=Pseudonocardia zijingensis TaxID=153376 RepID=A0ABP4A8C5_9PSEU
MEMKLELVPLPVADVERAKAFYTEKLGFVVDVDLAPGNGIRIVQLTPPSSACSILLSSKLPGVDDMTAGSLRALHLVVADARAARAELATNGVEVGEIDVHDGGMLFVPFTDPDGNTWVLQEMPWRAADFTA